MNAWGEAFEEDEEMRKESREKDWESVEEELETSLHQDINENARCYDGERWHANEWRRLVEEKQGCEGVMFIEELRKERKLIE